MGKVATGQASIALCPQNQSVKNQGNYLHFKVSVIVEKNPRLVPDHTPASEVERNDRMNE